MEKAKIPQINMKTTDISSLQIEFIKKLKKDSFVYNLTKKLGMSDSDIRANLGTLIDFQEDSSFCRECPGLEKCEKTPSHYEMEIAFDGRFVDRKYSPCHLMTKRMEAQARYLVRDFPDDWLERNMDAILSQKQSKLEFSKAYLSFFNNHDNRWLYVTGAMGSGRSFSLACFSNSFLKITNGNKQAAFCDTCRLIDDLKHLQIERKDVYAFRKEINDLCSVPLLVFDDFGNEYKSDFAFSSILFPIINYRAKNKLMTCFSSDFRIDQIGEMYSMKVSSERGQQIINILKTMTHGEIELSSVPNLY